MQIEFDPHKDALNQDKHGVSLALAGELEWESALVWIDDRFEYRELRMIALAPRTAILVLRSFCRAWRSAEDHQFTSSQSSGG